MKTTIHPAKFTKSRGIALIVSLLLLLVITLLALAGLRGTTLQEHMSGNLYARGLAFQATESALRYGEDAVKNSPQNFKSNKCIDTDPPPSTPTWTTTSRSFWTWMQDKKPEYRVENLGRGPGWGNEAECDGGSDASQYGSRCGELPEACYYRIAGRSPRDDGRADVQLEIIVRRRLEQK